MNSKVKKILIYSICHFIVDFLCAILVLGKITFMCESPTQIIGILVTYNFFAFAFQVPLGLLLDKIKIYNYISIIGMCLIGIGACINIGDMKNFILAVIMSIIVGIGNALFHLEGGTNIYELSEKKAFLNGFFVAPGALGIFLGTTFNRELVFSIVPIILVCISIVLLFFIQSKQIIRNNELLKNNNENKLAIILIVFLIGISVIVRSIGGSAIIYSWKNTFVLGLIFTLSIVTGKAFGGLFADKLGFSKVAIVSLLMSSIFLILGYNIQIFAYLGIFLFNVPMSITLSMLINSLKNKIACAVGLNTMFLFIGYLTSFIDITINNKIIFIISSLLAVISIYTANKLYLKIEKAENVTEEKKVLA